MKLKGNVLITGGLGFIGSNLAQRLINEEVNLTLFTNSLENIKNIQEIKEKVKIVHGDIRDFDKVKSIILNQDHIFHFAGQIDHLLSLENPKLDLDINCNGTLNILEACRKFNAKANIIFSSSVGVIGKAEKIPADESQRENPPSIYEIHKLTCERYMVLYNKLYNLPTTVLRFANVFGERQKMSVSNRGILNQMMRKAFLSETITIYGEGNFIRDYSYVQNYLDACICAALSENTKGEIYMIGSGLGLTFKDMVAILNKNVKELTGKSAEIKHVPFPETEKKIDRGDFIANCSKFKKATGWQPKISFEEGIKKTILFYKERLKEYL